MRLSRFLVVIPEESGNHLVTSTVTKAVARFNPRAWADLQNGNPASAKELTSEQWQQCLAMRFVVEDGCDEEKEITELFNRDRLEASSLSAYVAMTTGCNLACVYCYERGQVATNKMSRDVLKASIEWFERRLKTGAYKVCAPYLYGGEALLCKDESLVFVKAITELCHKYGVKHCTTLVTNGWYADASNIRTLIDAGLDIVHFTLDGPSEVHDVRRPLRDGGATFSRIFHNMFSVVREYPKLEIECRVNFDRSNLSTIPKLLDLLAESDKNRMLGLYFNYIYQTVTQAKSSCSFCSQNSIVDDREIAESLIFLYKEAHKRGYKVLDFYSKGPCMTVATNACLIDPMGDIYKCVDMIGCKSMVVGNVFADDPSQLLNKFMSAPAAMECLKTDCPFILLCAGGCAMESFVADGNPFRASCHREMLELVTKGLLPLRFS